MRLKKLGLAIMVVGALGAILASSAFATPTTTAAEWYKGTPTTTLTGSEAVNLKATGTAEFKVTVNSTLYDLTATGVECLSCTLTNSPTGASGTGKVKFTGVTVMSPPGCSVTGGTVTTNQLNVQADWMEGTKAMVKFEPTAGATAAFATVPVTGCAAALNLVPKGYVFAEASNATGVAASSQPITFSEAIHKNTASTINVAGNTAILSGVADASLATGEEFGVK